MAGPEVPEFVDTVVIGGGPSSLLLSYLLHGHIPHYVRQHFDPLLHRKLAPLANLLHVTPDVYAHFTSSLRYSTQALPIDTLFDTLVRPNADTEIDPQSCVEWRFEPEKAVSHLILTDAEESGGQWAIDTAGDAYGEDAIETLSYGEMLSLPGFSYGEYHELVTGQEAQPFERPTRREVAGYLARYPSEVGIERSILTHTRVKTVDRLPNARLGRNFGVTLQNGRQINCAHLVLGTGIFTHTIAPPALLQPLLSLSMTKLRKPSLSMNGNNMNLEECRPPILVIGSGFSAADAILATPSNTPIIHIYRWNPDTRRSPLKGCHQQAYPEYAGIYRRMKIGALIIGGSRKGSLDPTLVNSRKRKRFDRLRDWERDYEGLPNAEVVDVSAPGAGSNRANITIKLPDGCMIEREISGLRYVVGRRGSLDYLSEELVDEVLGPTVPQSGPSTSISSIPDLAATPPSFDNFNSPTFNTNVPFKHHPFNTTAIETPQSPRHLISGRSLRTKCEVSTEVAPSVWAIGSLTGDSLVRHAYGGCAAAAAGIMGVQQLDTSAAYGQIISGLNGATARVGAIIHAKRSSVTGDDLSVKRFEANTSSTAQHDDLHLDRREIVKSAKVTSNGG